MLCYVFAAGLALVLAPHSPCVHRPNLVPIRHRKSQKEIDRSQKAVVERIRDESEYW